MADIPYSLSRLNDVETASDSPITSAIYQKIGSSVNELINQSAPIGTIVYSMLTESQFQDAVIDSRASWVLADGRSVAGSAYATLTSSSTVPDLRGVFLRGKNNSRTDGYQNPGGELNLGQLQAQDIKSHTHTVSTTKPAYNPDDLPAGGLADLSVADVTNTTTATGGSESRPKNVTLNAFIRVD